MPGSFAVANAKTKMQKDMNDVSRVKIVSWLP